MNKKTATTILQLANKFNNQSLINKYEKMFEDDYYLDNYIKEKGFETFWRNGMKETKENIREFIQEITDIDEEWVRNRRMEYLEINLKRTFSKMQKLGSGIKEYNEYGKSIFGNKFVNLGKTVLGNEFKDVKRKYKRLFLEYASLRGDRKIEKRGEITDDVIERAKNYPIENLIDIKKNFALCINHEDHKPSMYCKNNFVYCFSCGFSTDSIGVVMKIHNLEFKEAVNFINNRI